MALVTANSPVRASGNQGTQPPSSVEELQQQRQDLVEQYVKARPEGSRGWSIGAGVGLGAVAAGLGMGAVLLSNRGHNSVYQGLNLMFMMPIALGAGGGIGYALGSRAGEMATRPDGDAATQQVEATRADLTQQIAGVDEQLAAADGRRPQALPEVDDTPKLSLGRVAGHTGAGLGLGVLATVGVLSGTEQLLGRPTVGGPTMLAAFAAPAIAAGAISYLDQRDEAAGRQGSFVRAAGIGAAAMGAASLMPALAPIPMPLRLLGGAAVGAAIGSTVHMVSRNSRD